MHLPASNDDDIVRQTRQLLDRQKHQATQTRLKQQNFKTWPPAIKKFAYIFRLPQFRNRKKSFRGLRAIDLLSLSQNVK